MHLPLCQIQGSDCVKVALVCVCLCVCVYWGSTHLEPLVTWCGNIPLSCPHLFFQAPSLVCCSSSLVIYEEGQLQSRDQELRSAILCDCAFGYGRLMTSSVMYFWLQNYPSPFISQLPWRRLLPRRNADVNFANNIHWIIPLIKWFNIGKQIGT